MSFPPYFVGDGQTLRRASSRFSRPARATTRKRISLALQGGGSFGAFTWGVLDRLLEENIPFDAISGASAGAMNAVLLASGLSRGGPAEARAGLERFWSRVSDIAQTARMNPFVPSGAVLKAITQTLAPTQFNPFGIDPLRDIICGEVDFDAVRTKSRVRLLLGATRVRDGSLRIFRNKAITADVVLASACLPHLHRPVAIDGEPHWDGGYAANPPLMPLITGTRASDVLVVQIIPTNQFRVPTTSPDIDKRLDQITFSSSLQKDFEAVAMMKKLSRAGGTTESSAMGRKLQRLQLHLISAEDHVEGLSGSSFQNAEWSFLTHLRDQGRAAAAKWLSESEQKSKVPESTERGGIGAARLQPLS